MFFISFSITGSSGGICEKSKLFSDGKKKSLNTGIITVQNYGSHVPPKVSHITFAHEVGHNFGSPVRTKNPTLGSSRTLCCLQKNLLHFLRVLQHDSGIECTPGESRLQEQKERGNYIMYARATSGDKSNNNKFSICSIRNISAVLKRKKDDCFVGNSFPFFLSVFLCLTLFLLRY